MKATGGPPGAARRELTAARSRSPVTRMSLKVWQASANRGNTPVARKTAILRANTSA
jgi:hypothetical protein